MCKLHGIVSQSGKYKKRKETRKKENMYLHLGSSFSFSKSQSLLLHHQPKLFSLSSTRSSYTTSAVKMIQTIEHIVLFKVKDNTSPSKINSMVNGLNSLISIDNVLHLSAGPIYKTRSTSSSSSSSSFNFTHMVHGRYKSKNDLEYYLGHPKHLSLVNETIDPICDDVMLVDWVANLDEPLLIVPSSGAVMRVSLLKLKENLEEIEKAEVLKVVGEGKENFVSINQFTFGENFAPVRTNGFSIASLAIVPTLSELEVFDSNKELVKEQKEKVKNFLESAIIVDYVVPPTTESL